MSSSKDIETLLKMQVVAVVGCSPKAGRPSNRVASYLMDAGYRIIPVNPGCEEILGERCYPDLTVVPDPVDVVLVFRRSEFVPEIARQAAAKGSKGLWLQIGVSHPAAAEQARKAGMIVVSDECFMSQHLSRMGR
ncbi:MAG: CoA-binding protein [Elusimicrobiota bacterium]